MEGKKMMFFNWDFYDGHKWAKFNEILYTYMVKCILNNF